MKLAGSLPAEGGFPAVEGFRCEQCRGAHQEVE